MPPRVMLGRRGGARGGRGGRNVAGRDALAALQRQIDALQEQLRRGLNPREESEDEGKEEGSNVEEEEEAIDQDQMRLIRAISKIGKRPRAEVPSYSGSLNPKELIDWINELEEYFEYEEIEDPNRVKFAKMKLKGHANIWWKEVQLEINRRGKGNITR